MDSIKFDVYWTGQKQKLNSVYGKLFFLNEAGLLPTQAQITPISQQVWNTLHKI
jgi:hypothetical protein